MERVARGGRLRAIRAAAGPSLGSGAGPPGAGGASWVLSGSRTEVGEGGRRSRAEASVEEGVLSCLEEEAELRPRHRDPAMATRQSYSMDSQVRLLKASLFIPTLSISPSLHRLH